MNYCQTCKFYSPLSQGSSGLCRRYPPNVIPSSFGLDTMWPEVRDLDTCGEHRTESAE